MTATSHPTDAQILLDEKLPSIVIIREFDAPREEVFRAHVDPEIFVQWIGPDSLDANEIDIWDARSGGEWRYVARRGAEEHWFRGCFHEIRDNEVIVQTFTYEGFADSVSLERLVLTDLGDGRTRLTATSLCDSFEMRDAMVASGMEGGIQDGYRKLDGLLAAR